MKEILVPIDGSGNSLRAAEYAVGAAKLGRGKVHLVNVQLNADDYGMLPAYLSPAKYRAFTRERAEAELEAAVARLKKSRVPFDVQVVYGDIAPTIVRVASRLKCDSIVMGTRGMGAAANLLLGSVANKVIHLARVPVTLVK